MEKMVLEGVELGFNDLSEQTQEKLYLQDKKKFQDDASKSQYASIRKLLIEDEECEPSILDEIFKVEIEIYKDIENLVQIWNHPKFEKTDEKRKVLAESSYWRIRIIAAEEEGSSSQLLNEMLRKEIENEPDEDVINAILNNQNFKMDIETFSLFANSEDEDYRAVAGSYMEDSIRLNELLRSEVEGENYGSVIDAILENECFEMEEETLEVLAESDDETNREIAVKSKKATSEFLNRILRDEVESIGACNVIKECMKNENFQMEEETLYVIEKEHDYDALTILAEDPNASQEWLEKIYLTETDGEVLEAAELNLLQKLHKSSIALNAVQKRKVLGVLKELKRSRKKKTLTKYLEEILEIIG